MDYSISIIKIVGNEIYLHIDTPYYSFDTTITTNDLRNSIDLQKCEKRNLREWKMD